MERLICRVCGENTLSLNDNTFLCSTCGSKFFKSDKEVRISKLIQDAFDLNKDNDLGTLKHLLRREMDKEHPNFIEITNLCLDIKKINDEDCIANYCYSLARRRHYPSEYINYLEKLIRLDLFDYEINWIFPLIITKCKRGEKNIIIELLNSKNKYDEYISLLEDALKLRDEEEKLFDSSKEVFICHKSDDYKSNVKPLVDILENEGPFSCWVSERNLPWDIENYWLGIQNAIRECKIFLFVLSSKSKISEDCLKEIDFASSINKTKKIEVRIDESENGYKLKKFFNGIQWVDIKNTDLLLERIDTLINTKEEVTEEVSIPTSKTEPKLRRVLMLVEEDNFIKADKLLEEVLNENPENGEAYAYKLLIDYKLHSLKDLKSLEKTLDSNVNYKNAIKYSKEKMKNELGDINECIKKTLLLKKYEEIYQLGEKYLEEKKYVDAIKQFERIKDYKDSSEKINKCIELLNSFNYNMGCQFINKKNYEQAKYYLLKCKEYKDSKVLLSKFDEFIMDDNYQLGISNFRNGNFSKAKEIFIALGDYKDSKDKVSECDEEINQFNYKMGIDNLEKQNFIQACNYLSKCEDYRDSKEKLKECNEKLKEKEKEDIYNKCIQGAVDNSKIDNLNFDLFNKNIIELEKIIDYKDTSEKMDNLDNEFVKNKLLKEQKEKIAKIKVKVFFYYVIITFAIVFILTLLGHFLVFPWINYNIGVNYLNNGEYDKAINCFEGNYFYNSQFLYKEIQAVECFENGSFEEGIDIIYNLGGEITVSYDGDGGTPSKESEIIKKNKYIDTYSDLDDCIFLRWELSGYKFDFKNCKVDLYLTAKYSKNVFHIYLYSSGGECEKEIVYFLDDTGSVSLPSPTKIGYSFDGWYSKNTGLITNNQYIINDYHDIMLIAKWHPTKYYIYRYLNTEKTESLNILTYTIESSDINISIPKKEGYTFLGWTTDENDIPVKNFTVKSGSIGNVYLYANWEPIEYVLTYNLNGGVLESDKLIIHYDEEYILPTPTKTGYEFVEWVGDSNIIDNTVWKSTSNQTIEAVWIPVEYLLKYDLDGGEATLPNNYYITTPLTLLDIPSKTGYSFLGWRSETDDIVIEYYYGGGTIGNINLKAVWQPNEYKITLDSNGGETEVDYINIIYDSNYELPEPSFADYDFDGWYLDDKKIEDNYVFEENVTIKAKWKFYKLLDNNSLLFGRFPQSRVTDSDLLERLNDYVIEKYGSGNSNWEHYEENKYSSSTNKYEYYHFYVDVDIDDDGAFDYRCDAISDYRPAGYQESNGYTNGRYWFKYEPVNWNILDSNDKFYYITSEIAIDSLNYNDSLYSRLIDGVNRDANEYKYSKIRSWINDSIYSFLFNIYEKKIINNEDIFKLSNCNDNLFLLSLSDVNKYFATDSSRILRISEYGKCQGGYSIFNNSDNSYVTKWWVRTPYNESGAYAVLQDGKFGTNVVNYYGFGIRPACVIEK